LPSLSVRAPNARQPPRRQIFHAANSEPFAPSPFAETPRTRSPTTPGARFPLRLVSIFAQRHRLGGVPGYFSLSDEAPLFFFTTARLYRYKKLVNGRECQGFEVFALRRRKVTRHQGMLCT